MHFLHSEASGSEFELVIKGKGQPRARVIIYINLKEIDPQMLHTHFQGNRPRGFNIYRHGGHFSNVTWNKYKPIVFPLRGGLI